jgi:hypothetical protein
MPTTNFPTPLFTKLWNRDSRTSAALAMLTIASPFDQHPEWILPYLSEDGIDFDALRDHWFATAEEDAIVAMAASMYGYEMETGPAAVRLGDVMEVLSWENFVTVTFAMHMAAGFPQPFTTPGAALAPAGGPTGNSPLGAPSMLRRRSAQPRRARRYR